MNSTKGGTRLRASICTHHTKVKTSLRYTDNHLQTRSSRSPGPGAIIWDPYAKKDIDVLERMQRDAHFITGDYRTAHQAASRSSGRNLTSQPYKTAAKS
jgi:hypothetical protein